MFDNLEVFDVFQIKSIVLVLGKRIVEFPYTY